MEGFLRLWWSIIHTLVQLNYGNIRDLTYNSLKCLCYKEEVLQETKNTLSDLPKNKKVGFSPFIGILYMKYISCLNNVCIFLFCDDYVLLRIY